MNKKFPTINKISLISLNIQAHANMGADIKVKGDTAFVTGVKKLEGSEVLASDIRASCALVLAGLVAKGQTVVEGLHHFLRGYDNLDKKLQQLGADIKVVSEVQKSRNVFEAHK